jgi:hypothetical protein
MVVNTVNNSTGMAPKASVLVATSTHSPGSNALFFLSSKIKLLHQHTSLLLAYDRKRGWGYQGESAMYNDSIDAKSCDNSMTKGCSSATKGATKDTISSNVNVSSTHRENNKMAPANNNALSRTTSRCGATSLDGDGKSTIKLALHPCN